MFDKGETKGFQLLLFPWAMFNRRKENFVEKERLLYKAKGKQDAEDK